jgi:uncharacterized membrane protein YkvA (DUF1232 family)
MKDFYQVLKENIGDYSGRLDDIVYLAPDFFQLMTRLLDDPRVPRSMRPYLNAAIAYFVVPFDPIPEEAHGPYGYIDDVYVCALTAKKIIDELGDGSVLEENWEGEESIAKTLEDVLATDIDELKEKEEEILRYLGLEEE